jgi:two-component system sensor histidine kinase AgrC
MISDVIFVVRQVLTLLSLFIEVYWLLVLLYRTFGLKNRFKFHLRIIVLYCCFETIILVCNNYNNYNNIYNFLIYLTIHFVMGSLFCGIFINEGIYKFLVIPIYICSLITAQNIASNVIMVLFSIRDSNLHFCIYLIFSKVILFFVFRFMIKYSVKIQYKLPDSYNAIMIFVFSMENCFIFYMFLIFDSLINIVLIIALQVAVFMVNLTFYFMYEKIIENYEDKLKYMLINQQLYLQQHTLEEIEKESNSYKSLRHDLKNHILCIQVLLQNQEYEKASQYLSELNNSAWIPLINSGNKVVDAVLNSKLAYAKSRNIPIYIEAYLPNEIGIMDFELCSILSNIVDNAIEASERVMNPEIKLKIKAVNNYLLISVSNKLSGNVKIRPDFKTTKDDKKNHGIGISVIKGIVSNYKGNVSFSIKDGYFQASVLLPLSPRVVLNQSVESY